MRVCLDTNVLVAAFATRGLCADVFRVVLPEHDLIVGEVILVELRRVLTTKFKVPADRIDAIDRWIVATAVAGDADVLVTGDRDLLDVQNELPIRTLDPRAFWELLRTSQR